MGKHKVKWFTHLTPALPTHKDVKRSGITRNWPTQTCPVTVFIGLRNGYKSNQKYRLVKL